MSSCPTTPAPDRSAHPLRADAKPTRAIPKSCVLLALRERSHVLGYLGVGINDASSRATRTWASRWPRPETSCGDPRGSQHLDIVKIERFMLAVAPLIGGFARLTLFVPWRVFRARNAAFQMAQPVRPTARNLQARPATP